MKIHPDRYVCYFGRKEVNLHCDTCQYCKIHELDIHKTKIIRGLHRIDDEISERNVTKRLKEGFALLNQYQD